MSKSKVFKFKQFEIAHQESAMKVGTDGVLIGAWVNINNCKTILDIGTGSGLIPLMLAQRSKAAITAIEIEEDAFKEACSNVKQSPWSDQIEIVHIDLKKFCEKTSKKFDLIISNPPFFFGTTALEKRSLARDNKHLSLESLIHSARKMLSTNGKMAFILPIQQEDSLKLLMDQENLFLEEMCYVQGNLNSKPKRILTIISKFEVHETKKSTLAIELENRHQYSKEYQNLTREYYLNF